jgi:DNA-binding transcriptional LysR family regulator
MARDGISWDDLRYLEALGRLGTAGRAARELGASASTVYRRIASLEAALGVGCVRSGQGGLTGPGEALAAVAAQTAAAIEEVARRARDDARASVGEVSITTVEGAMPLVAGPLAMLTAAHPDLSLRLVIGDLGPSVRRREVDLAIGVMPSPPESLWGRRLFPIHYGVYGTRDACALSNPAWITTGDGLKLADRAAWERDHAERVVATTGSVPTLAQLLRAGMGIAVFPDRLGRDDPELVELARYRASLEPLSRTAWLLTHPELRDVQRVRVVMDALFNAFEADR